MRLRLCYFCIVLVYQVYECVGMHTEEHVNCNKVQSDKYNQCVRETNQRACGGLTFDNTCKEGKYENTHRFVVKSPTLWSLLNKSKSHMLALFMISLLSRLPCNDCCTTLLYFPVFYNDTLSWRTS
uniref:Kazal-like domain-containing protein n=1 Tax=Ciona savignyi TaxID=51511 RepID=H2YIH3_CIOSA